MEIDTNKIYLRIMLAFGGLFFSVWLLSKCGSNNNELVDSKDIDNVPSSHKLYEPKIAAEVKYNDLFSSPSGFQDRFNEVSNEASLDFYIRRLNIEEGSAQNLFRYNLSNNLALLGTIRKENGGVKELTMICTSDGTMYTASNMLIAMMAMIAVVDPNLPPNQREEVLKDMHVFDKKYNLWDMEVTAHRNGFEYHITSQPAMGLWFSISKD